MGLSLLDPRVWLAIALLMLGAYGAGRWHQHKADDAKAKAELVEAMQAARAKEDAANEAVRINRRARDAEMDRINSRLAGALDELRKRPERRVPAPTGAACEGSSGAELSRPDAEFLSRLAARADSLRAALTECYQYVDSLPR